MASDYCPMIITTNAIVLHSRRYSDSSRIVVLYTEQLGKVSVVAKGARTGKSAFGSAIEPLSNCRVSIYHKKGRELHTASAADVVQQWKNISKSYEHMRVGMTLAEVVMRTQDDEEQNSGVYNLLLKAMNTLDNVDADSAYGVGLAVRLRLAGIMGFGLQRVGTVPVGMALSVSLEDGIARNEAFSSSAMHIRMSTSAFTNIVLAMNDSGDSRGNWSTIRASAADTVEIENFISSYFSHHLDKRVGNNVMSVLR